MAAGIHPAARLLIYCVGILLVSAGIVLCKYSSLGISPISTVPYVLEKILPVSFGALTMYFHFANTAVQMALRKTIKDPKLLLQIPLAFAFGQTINLMQRILYVDQNSLVMRWIALGLGIVLTAAGMVCMLLQDLVANPPDGTVKEISEKTGWKFGNVKIGYDIAMVVIAALIGLIFLHTITGIGIGTLLSALLTGRCVSLFQNIVNRTMRKENI